MNKNKTITKFNFTFSGKVSIVYKGLNGTLEITENISYKDVVESKNKERPTLKELMDRAVQIINKKMKSVECVCFHFNTLFCEYDVDDVNYVYDEDLLAERYKLYKYI